jgi:hypothetical protein
MNKWPDPLQPPNPAHIQELRATFWETLVGLPELIDRGEQVLCHETTTTLRAIVLEIMLALNGITYPAGTRHLNRYLGASQREAIQKTLLAPAVDGDTWIGQAVALVVIYRWYAPQLVATMALVYPQMAEDAALAALGQLPSWPLTITTA